MRKFQEEYRRAADMELPEFHMDIKTVRDELHHRRMRVWQRRRMAVKGCAAAAVFLLLGAGTAAAGNYVSAVIRMRSDGYVVSSPEHEKSVLQADAGAAEEDGGAWSAAAKTEVGVLNAPTEGEDGAVALEARSLEGIEKEEGIAVLDDSVEEIPIEEAEYENLSEFLQEASAASKIPNLSTLQGEIKNGRVFVMEDGMTIFVRVTENERSFYLRQSDFRNTEGFSTATVYGGENANERNLINAQGLDYTVFDTVDEDGRVETTHAVIMVEGRELSMDFSGFEPEIIESVLKELSLELYFR